MLVSRLSVTEGSSVLGWALWAEGCGQQPWLRSAQVFDVGGEAGCLSVWAGVGTDGGRP